VTRHELRCGALVAALPSRDEVQIRLAIATSRRVCHSGPLVDASEPPLVKAVTPRRSMPSA